MNVGDKVKTIAGHKPEHIGTVVAVNVRTGNDTAPDTSHIAIKEDEGSPWLVISATLLQPA